MTKIRNLIFMIPLTLFAAGLSMAATATPAPMKVKILDSNLLYTATVTAEQQKTNSPTLHIYEGKVVDREIAKAAFFRGETSCRVFLDGESPQVRSGMTVHLIMEVPVPNRTTLAFIDESQSALFAVTCQAQNAKVTRESILRTLGGLVEEIKNPKE